MFSEPTLKIKPNEFSRRKLPYSFTHHGIGLAISRLQKSNFEIKNILRWEDDGGQINRWDDLSNRPAATQTNNIVQVSITAHIDPFDNEISQEQLQMF